MTKTKTPFKPIPKSTPKPNQQPLHESPHTYSEKSDRESRNNFAFISNAKPTTSELKPPKK